MADNYKFMIATRCMTYNQAPYIEETLYGFIIQETSFRILYIIVDDCSTDGEQDLLREWADNNLLMEERGIAYRKEMPYGEMYYARHKSRRNAFFLFLLLSQNLTQIGKGALKTKYISEWNESAKYNAICEGDDYWINPHKLQEQVNYLETHPEVGLVYTDVNILNQEDKSFKENFFKSLPIKNTHEDYLLNTWFLAPCTWVYRSELSQKIPVLDRRKYFTGDTLWILTYSKYSKVFFLNEVTAVYREHKGSASHLEEYERLRLFRRKNFNTRLFFLKDKSMSFRLIFWWKEFKRGRPLFKTQLRYYFQWLIDGISDLYRVFS